MVKQRDDLGIENMDERTNQNGGIREPLLLSPRQAARALSISERTLWQRTKDGVIPAVKLGHLVRYSPEDLRTWIRLASEKKCGNMENDT